MTNRDFNPFPGNQIQCAALLPDSTPRIILVSDENKLFVMRYQDNRWKSESKKVNLGKGRKDISRFSEKMSIAASENGIIRAFWMQGEEGRLLSIDQHGGVSPEAEKISMPF